MFPSTRVSKVDPAGNVSVVFARYVVIEDEEDEDDDDSMVDRIVEDEIEVEVEDAVWLADELLWMLIVAAMPIPATRITTMTVTTKIALLIPRRGGSRFSPMCARGTGNFIGERGERKREILLSPAS
jgi:hypothetical protein